MDRIIIGIDPDSDRHGVAMYEDGQLTDLSTRTLMNIILYIEIW